MSVVKIYKDELINYNIGELLRYYKELYKKLPKDFKKDYLIKEILASKKKLEEKKKKESEKRIEIREKLKEKKKAALEEKQKRDDYAVYLKEQRYAKSFPITKEKKLRGELFYYSYWGQKKKPGLIYHYPIENIGNGSSIKEIIRNYYLNNNSDTDTSGTDTSGTDTSGINFSSEDENNSTSSSIYVDPVEEKSKPKKIFLNEDVSKLNLDIYDNTPEAGPTKSVREVYKSEEKYDYGYFEEKDPFDEWRLKGKELDNLDEDYRREKEKREAIAKKKKNGYTKYFDYNHWKGNVSNRHKPYKPYNKYKANTHTPKIAPTEDVPDEYYSVDISNNYLTNAMDKISDEISDDMFLDEDDYLLESGDEDIYNMLFG
jgi:hypothetical protein